MPLYWQSSTFVPRNVGLVVVPSEMCLTMIPLSEFETSKFVKSGIESSTQTAAAAARVAPEVLVIDISDQTPPLFHHRLTPRVIRFCIATPRTRGAEEAPDDIPMPYLQVVEEPCKS